jgi:hypothetical protein
MTLAKGALTKIYQNFIVNNYSYKINISCIFSYLFPALLTLTFILNINFILENYKFYMQKI